MAQWGTARTFDIAEGGTIRVLPHVDTDGFAPIDTDSIIDDLILMNVTGNVEVGCKTWQEFRIYWVGRSYMEWETELRRVGSASIVDSQ